MRLCAAVLATTLLATAGGAGEVGFPLVVDHALLRATLARQLGEEPDGSSVLWGSRGGCRSLVLRDLRVGAVPGRLRASVEPARARPVLEALATLHPLGVSVDDDGIKVRVALQLPPGDATASPAEPPLAPPELARWQRLVESWDGFLVFVVK